MTVADFYLVDKGHARGPSRDIDRVPVHDLPGAVNRQGQFDRSTPYFPQKGMHFLTQQAGKALTHGP